MNWAQENKTLAGIVGVMVAGGLGLGVWLYMSWSEYSASRDQWQQTQSRITSIRSKKLAPTPENVTLREKQLGDYAEKVNQLRGALLAVQQGAKPISETEFQARLKERATEIRKMATTLGLKDQDLPNDFALGFEKYATQPPRSPEMAAELNVHLDAIEKLVSTCLEAGVASIIMLERTKLPNEDIPPPPKTTPVKVKAKTTSKSKAKKPVITEQAAAEPVLDRYPIKLRITTDQVPFQTIVNTLCHPGKMPHFMVLRLVRVENSRLDGPSKEEVSQRRQPTPAPGPDTTTPKPSTTTTEPPKPNTPQVIAPVKPLPEDAFDIMGREMLQVYLEVDYIRFRPAAEMTEEEEAPAVPGAPAAPAKP